MLAKRKNDGIHMDRLEFSWLYIFQWVEIDEWLDLLNFVEIDWNSISILKKVYKTNKILLHNLGGAKPNVTTVTIEIRVPSMEPTRP